MYCTRTANKVHSYDRIWYIINLLISKSNLIHFLIRLIQLIIFLLPSLFINTLFRPCQFIKRPYCLQHGAPSYTYVLKMANIAEKWYFQILSEFLL